MCARIEKWGFIMSIMDKTRDAYQALLHHSKQSPILILHPRSKYRSLLLAHLINDPDVRAYYYAMGADDDNLRGFLEGMLHEIPEQHPTFGRHMNLLDADVYENTNEHLELLVETFARELSELHNSNYLLIIDEYDRSDRCDDIHRFIELLADQMPENCHLVLNGRMLPRLPWVSMVSKKQAALLLDHQLMDDNFYNNRRDNGYDLEVFGLGDSRVIYQAQEVEKWEGHLPRLLFFFTLDKPTVTRSEICRAFWPELHNDQAVNVFHVTKRRLHKAMKFDVLVHTESLYQVDPSLSVYYDVLDFVETLTKGRNQENGSSVDYWQHAIQLYRGAFLHGHTDAWIIDRRASFQMGYLEALSEIAQIWSQQGKQEMALDVYKKGVEENHLLQDFHRAIMQLYDDLGRRSEAVAHYEAMANSFSRQNIPVEAETTALYERLSG